MKIIKRHSVKLYLALAVAGLATLYLWPALVAAMPLTARHHLERAFLLAADVSHYDYQSTVVRTSHPTLSLGNVGRTATTEQFIVDGQLDRPADLMTMNIAAPSQPPLEVKLEQGRAYGRMSGVDGMAEWTEVEAGTDLFAPGGDPLAFLNIVENVRRVDQNASRTAADNDLFPAEMLPVTLADSISRYQFDVSGLKYAQQMRANLERALRDRGELPAGMSLQTPQQYVDMTGHGEIWVSDSGLPLRQIVHMEFPPEPGADVWIEAEITTNFSNWQNPGLTYALLNAIPRIAHDPTLLSRDPLSLLPPFRSPLANLQANDLQAFGILLGLSLLLIALGVMAITHRRSPKFYGALSLSMIALMLVTPLLRSHQAYAATTRLRARQAQFEQQQATQQAAANSQVETPAAPFNPNQNPLDRNGQTPEAGSRIADNNQLTTDNLQLTISNSADSSTPNPHALIPHLQTSCVITASSDCDGDGLTDNVEIYQLGTRIDKIDTDGDGISDGTEVAPFSVGGQDWYLDPLSADSNGDGLEDGAECLGRTDVVTTTLLIPLLDTCNDTDSDGVPNVYDFDDDGDGVPDSEDMAPLEFHTVASQTFNLEISGATADTDLFVDFQIRPTNDSHLWWTNSVLNWPDGDTSGQIRRVTTDTLTADGDMQLIPMLEIVIPYSADNPAGGLPISGTQTITATSPITSWLDTGVMSQYNISIVTTANNDRVAYLPLVLTTDSNGGSPLAWQARMPYKLASGITNWGAAHQVKLVWVVSGQSDTCETGCDDPANWKSSTQILQTYYDDFIVTGMKVQEYHGAEAMMIAQSSNTGPYEPELWHLADTLQRVYFNSQTVNDQRFTLSDIPATYTSWGMAGGSLTFNHITGLNDDVALLEAVTGDAVPNFLSNSVYGSPADGTVANVMLLSEETHRQRTMGDVDITDNGTDATVTERFVFTNNTFTVDLGSKVLETTGAMRLQPYKFTTELGWSRVDINLFMADLQTDLESIFTPSVMTGLLNGDPVTDIDQATAGAVMVAMHYYLSLYMPAALLVAVDGQPFIGDALVNSDHLRPAEPAAAIVQRLTTNLKTYFGLRNLNQLDIPTVESEKAASAAAAWGALATSRGAILEGFGDVLQGNSASSAALALLEISGYADTVDTDDLVDGGVYAIMNYVIRDFVSGKVIPFLTKEPGTISRGCEGEAGCIAFAAASSSVYAALSYRGLRLKYVKRNLRAAKDGAVGAPTAYYDLTRARKFLNIELSKPNPQPGLIESYKLSLAKAQAVLDEIITSKIKFWGMSGVILQGATSGLTITIALATGQVQADSPAFSRLLAEQISALIVETFLAILYFVSLTVASFALSIFLTVLAIVDIVTLAVCEVFSLNQNETVARWVCGGITGALTQALAYVINDTTPLVDLTREDRLNMVLDTPAINSDSGLEGVIVGNSITLNGTVTTTLYMDNPNWMGYTYWWQWTDNYLDDAAFKYKLQNSAQDIPVALRTITWEDVPGKKNNSVSANDARFQKQLPIEPITFGLTAPGINQGLPVYFSEGFAVRQQNCWLTVVGALITCWLSDFDDTSHESLENSFIFDVLPGNIDEFRALVLQENSEGKNGYRLAWDTQFPILADADGDGLRSQALGGVDPDDSTPDTDGDGLNDYFELNTTGFDATQADADCDGLTDYYELLYRTNPAKADTDGDGLLDGEEMFHPNHLNPYENSALTNLNAPTCATSKANYSGGWQIVYDYDNSGTPLTTWVSADPVKVDSDDDSLTDKQERIYAYNPNVASTLNVLRLDSQIETDGTVFPFVSPTGAISYTAVVTNELTLPYARGLLETELPLDNVLRVQSLGIVAPQSAVTVNDSLNVTEAGLNTSGSVDMGLRAGAIIDDPTGRVLWLHFNEAVNSTTFADDSFLQNDATCTGGACPAANAQSLTFDGGDAIVVPDSDDLDLSQYTIALAVKPTTSGNYRTLLAKTSDIGHGQNYNLELGPDNAARFVTLDGCAPGNGYNAISTSALPLNQWSHLAASFDGSTKKLYLNGTLVASTAYSGTPCQNNDPVYIGARYGQDTLVQPFTGQLDEVEIYPTVLDDATILARYATPVLQLDLRDDTTWGSDAASCTGAACPTAGNSGATFAQANHLNVTAPDLSGDAFAFATWIKPESRSAPLDSEVGTSFGKDVDRDWQGVFGNMVADSNQTTWPYASTIYPSLFVSSDGALRMMMANNSDACQVTTNPTGLVQNDTWQHVVVSYDGSNFTFYINGQPITGGLTSNGVSCAGIVPPSVSTVYVGRPNDYGYAWVDRVYIQNAEDEDGALFPIDLRLNRDDDGEGGNIWSKDGVGDDTTSDINQPFFLDDSSNQWIRLYEHDRNPSNSYDPNSTFWNSKTDDNLIQITNIKNNSRLGITGYGFEGPEQGPSRRTRGTLYFGVFNDYFQGELDDFQVYNYALNDALVADIYNAAGTSLDLTFDEAPGASLFADQSGNSVNVSCSGNTCPTSGVPGRFNQALDFDGVDDYLTIGATATELGTNAGNFSAMMWIKPDTFRGTNDSDFLPLLEIGNGWELSLSGYGRMSVTAPGNLTLVDREKSLYNDIGRWYHLAYVLNNGKWTFYLNGENIGTRSFGSPGASNALRIGRATNTFNNTEFNFYFDGLLDDLTIVKRSLSQAEVQAYLKRVPLVNLHLDEDLSLTNFADDSQNRYNATCSGSTCPEAGDKGQMREAVTFNGSNTLTLADTANLALTNFSVGAWVKPTKSTNERQYIITKGQGANTNMRLYLNPYGTVPRFEVANNSCGLVDGVESATPLLANQWNHVLASHDATSRVTKIYVNGALAGTKTIFDQGICTGNSDPIRLGQDFNGGLDEVSVIPTVLTDDDVAAMYSYQAAWFDVINQHTIFVDADSPTVDLSRTPAHVPAAETVMYIGADDASSPLTSVEYRIDGGSWQAATPNNNEVATSAAWLFYFDEAAGSHTIEARATDSVSNTSSIASATVQVDGQAPAVTINTTPDVVQALADYDLDGTVSDADSGVAGNGVTLAMVDHTGTPVGGNQKATVESNTWQASQPFNETPYGVYTATVSAVDEAGNRATASGLFKLDGLPPYADVTDDEHFVTTTLSKTITGIASDVPYPGSGRTLHLHFEPGTGLWVDGSRTGFTMTCDAAVGECPTTDVAGPHGRAITFDGSNDHLDFTRSQSLTATTTAQELGLSNGSFTVLAWVKADDWSGDQAILGSGPITTTDDFYLGLQNGSPILSHDSDDTVLTDTLPTGEWVHLGWRFDADSGQRSLFVNGTLALTSTGHSPFSATDTIQVGQMQGGNAYRGSLDELVIYSQPLADETIYDIANPLDVGVSELELRVRAYDERDIGQFEGDWNPVSLDNTGQLFSTWDYDLPALENGAYKIDLRVTDALGNSNFVDGAWDVAVVAPDLTISKQSAITLAQTSQTISYTISYTNAGPALVSGVVITETVPTDTAFTATLSHPGWACLSNGTCNFAVGDLAAGASANLTFTVTVTDSWSAGTTVISNTVAIGSDEADGTPADNRFNHQIPIDGGVDLLVSIVDDGTAFQHDPSGVNNAPPMTYTIAYTNSGSQPAQPQLAVSWSQGGSRDPFAPDTAWTCEVNPYTLEGANTCTRPVDPLGIGQSGSVTFTLRTSYYVPDDKLITTTVNIEDLAGATEIITGNNIASVVTPIELDYALVPQQASLTIQEGDVVTNGVELLVPPDTDLMSFLFTPEYPGPSAGEFFDVTYTGTEEDLTWQWVYTSTDGPEQTQAITWVVGIGEGSFTVNSVFPLTVENVTPTLTITGDDTVANDATYSLSLGDVVDPGDDTVTTCLLDWGDGSSDDCFSSLGGGTLTHTFGISYTTPLITVNLTDEDGTHVAASKTVTVTGLTPNFSLDQTSVTVYESMTATNSGSYTPADANLTWLVSEGTVTHTNGLWNWSLPPGSEEGTRPVTITADSQTINFNVTVQGDGVPSSIEAGAPNSGDGNNDGTPDQAQMHVASLPSPLTGQYVTLAASPGMTLTNVSLTATPAAGDGSQPPGIQFPLGYLDFDLTGMGAGGKTNVTLLITGTNNINSYARYDAANGWYTFLYDPATATGAELVSDERIILYLVDGDRGDGDGVANGTVANLGGPATQQRPKTLTVNISGSGSVSPTAGDYAQGTMLTMEATPDPGWRFSSWSGALSGSAISQTLTMNQNKSVTAIFVQESYTLVDQVVGGGSINLDPDQSNYVYSDVVTATATANPGWSFAGWSGDLSGSPISQSLAIDGNKFITATFTQDAYTVMTVTNGNGSVILNPDQSSYVYGDQIAVEALPDPGYTFQGWSGDLNSDAPLENLTIDGNKAITALFTTAVYSVETSVEGNGSITVEPDQATYSYGDVVTATATPAAGWSLSGWQLGLSGITATEALTITGNTNLLAVFGADAYILNTGWVGDGGVMVTPDQPGYSYGDMVTATAVPNTGWTFIDWSGSITDTALTTTVTMTDNKSILATFAPITYTLTVNKDGSGGGTVSSLESLIDCGSDCSEPLGYGTVISLTATPDADSIFEGWSGEANGLTSPITFTISGDTVVTATFGLAENVNDAPVLTTIDDQSVDEGETVSFTTVATDTGVPTQTLTFSLSDAPIAANIGGSTGLFSWVTNEADGPGVYTTTVIVSDGVLTDSQTVNITVNEVNEAPVLTPIAGQTVTQGETISFTVVATDTDVPTQTLAYSLSGETPVTATIDSGSGFFSWATTEADDPGIYPATIIVSDGTLTDSVTVSITVKGSNILLPIIISEISPQLVDETEVVTFTPTVTGSNLNDLSFSLENAPDGATIDSNGFFSWTTDETDGPGVYTPTVIVSNQVTTDSAVVQITVNEVNQAPVLAAIGDQSVDEGQTLSFTATATDSDVPTQTLTFSLSEGPGGAGIDGNSGEFSWLTTEADGPGVYSATVIVSDGTLTDSETINITVNEVDSPPTLAAIAPQTITETETLSFSAVATDAEDNGLIFDLYNPSSGMTIDPDSGEFTWTPTEVQGPGTYFFSIIVTDTTDLTDTTIVMITVNELNEVPVLAAIGDQTIAELEPFSLTLSATDPDLPANNLTFSMTNAPTAASLDANSGLFSWTPNEIQGPGQYPISFSVTDDGIPVLDDSETITITVTEVNEAPVLAAIGDQSVDEGDTLSFTATATDSDVPTQTLTFSLSEGPVGAIINQATGLFTWTTGSSNGPGSYFATVIVSDGVLTDSETINIMVNNLAPVVSVDVPTQTVQYSDAISVVTVTAGDASRGSLQLVATGLPGDLIITPAGCSEASGRPVCTWTLSGTVSLPAGDYVVQLTVEDDQGDQTNLDLGLTVVPEDAAVTFRGGNPIAVPVAEPGGNSGIFRLEVNTRERYPDLGVGVQPGDIALAEVDLQLVPVGPGSPVDPEPNSCTVASYDTGYQVRLTTSCDFDNVPVNTYAVQVTVNGGYYDGFKEDVLTVYDPSLGFTSGGGTFYWPGTADPENDYLGDKTTFGYTMEYNKKGKNVKGSLMLIRQTADESTYQVKSNALKGLALGEDASIPWASFSGKATYLEPDWSDPEGNHEFLVYAEDGTNTGTGPDRFWLEMKDKGDDIIPAMSMEREATENAVEIEDGNIIVPHGLSVSSSTPSGQEDKGDNVIFLPLIIKTEPSTSTQ